ncbi:hypothetical protein BJY01DRAFT_171766 [Aspergillus pseudoustus]|uniref:Uncharacterized protein n=1 Tax=Aspergillus pseudoustus TaxID=1810923 RepID=A0ABR4KZQ1_9EURO
MHPVIYAYHDTSVGLQSVLAGWRESFSQVVLMFFRQKSVRKSFLFFIPVFSPGYFCFSCYFALASMSRYSSIHFDIIGFSLRFDVLGGFGQE